MTESTESCQVGLIGLGVMGQNLALNIARHEFSLAAFDLDPSRVETFLANKVDEEPIRGVSSLTELAAVIAPPRRIVLMVPAGQAVDDVIDALRPHLDGGDIIVDAGNSHPSDTERRTSDLASHDIAWVGMGVSGGARGALDGPSLMPGGSPTAYASLEPILTAIAARHEDAPCVAHIGAGAAGHFVKMVHNGIEYADMQLLAEAYDVLHHGMGLDATQIGATFARWNEGPLASYLVEISANIFGVNDPETGTPLVELIVDAAQQKGTGRWTVETALSLGTPTPTLQAAVDARAMSARREERKLAAAVLAGPEPNPLRDHRLAEDLGHAIYASKICAYAQGLDLIRAAGEAHEWGLDPASIARVWKAGCIIRGAFLEEVEHAYQTKSDLANLLLAPKLTSWLDEHHAVWREILGLATGLGIPVPAMSASLAYYDTYRRERLPQSLTQAQRDYFGSHTYQRVDRPDGERFHTDWTA